MLKKSVFCSHVVFFTCILAYTFSIAHYLRKDKGWIHLQHVRVAVALTLLFFRLKTRKKKFQQANATAVRARCKWLPVVSIQVYSVVSRPWLKERRKFTQNASLYTRTTVTGSEQNFCAFSLLEFVSKRPVSLQMNPTKEQIT